MVAWIIFLDRIGEGRVRVIVVNCCLSPSWFRLFFMWFSFSFQVDVVRFLGVSLVIFVIPRPRSRGLSKVVSFRSVQSSTCKWNLQNAPPLTTNFRAIWPSFKNFQNSKTYLGRTMTLCLVKIKILPNQWLIVQCMYAMYTSC